MKLIKLAVAAGLAVTAMGAMADTNLKLTTIDNVANVYGRSGVPITKVAGAVVTHPADAVYPGATIVAGRDAAAIKTAAVDVNNVLGRS